MRHYAVTVAAVRDRIVQAAVKIVLEPVFEADFLPCSFGFRPKLSPHDALQGLFAGGGGARVGAACLACSFGFRPKLSPHDALQVLIDGCARGRRWVVETDIASCFT